MTNETVQLVDHNASDLIEIEKQNPFLTSKIQEIAEFYFCIQMNVG